MIRPILTSPNARLRAASSPIADEEFGTEAIYEIAQDLFDTCVHHEALGLAAIQIGIARRVFAAMLVDGSLSIVCNPVVVDALKPARGEEGCLSFPGVTVGVEAPTVMRVRFRTVDGEPVDTIVRGMAARTFWHETQHLDGKLLVDRLGPLARREFLKQYGKRRTV